MLSLYKTNFIKKLVTDSAVKQFGWYLVKFLGIFCFFYYGTIIIISCESPDGIFYSPWVFKHFYYLDVLRDFYLRISFFILQFFGYQPVRISMFVLKLGNAGISLNNACLGYGIISFWVAFIIADTKPFKQKIIWLLSGIVCFILLNVIRICLILFAGYYKWVKLGSIDHHSLFNYASYIVILLLIYFYSRKSQSQLYVTK